MDLSKTQKIILGIFTFFPFILLPFIALQVVHAIMEIIRISKYEPEAEQILPIVFSFIGPVILLGLSCLVLLIFYLVHAIVNKKIEPAEQLLWIVLFIFFGIIAFPVYWFLRIWNIPVKA